MNEDVFISSKDKNFFTLFFDQMNQLKKIVDHFWMFDFLFEECFDVLVEIGLVQFLTD